MELFPSGPNGTAASAINVTLLAFSALGMSAIVSRVRPRAVPKSVLKVLSFAPFAVGSVLGFLGFVAILIYSNGQQHPMPLTFIFAFAYVFALANVQMATVRAAEGLWD